MIAWTEGVAPGEPGRAGAASSAEEENCGDLMHFEGNLLHTGERRCVLSLLFSVANDLVKEVHDNRRLVVPPGLWTYGWGSGLLEHG